MQPELWENVINIAAKISGKSTYSRDGLSPADISFKEIAGELTGINGRVCDRIGVNIKGHKFFASPRETSTAVNVIQSKITREYRSTW